MAVWPVRQLEMVMIMHANTNITDRKHYKAEGQDEDEAE